MEEKANQTLLNINLLGNPEISFENEVLLQLPKKILALLAYLAIEQKVVQRSKLILLFWSNLPDKSARANLRSSLPELKKALRGYLQSTTQTASLDWEKPILVDALELEKALASETLDLKRLNAAINFYRGDFLAGLELKNTPEFDAWHLNQQKHFQQLAFEAFSKLIEVTSKERDYDLSLSYAQRMLELDHWREESHYQLIYLYGMQGNRTAALQQYKQCKEVLAKALKIKPNAAIEKLVTQIKLGELESLSQTSKIRNLDDKSLRDMTPPAFLQEEVSKTLFVGRKKELSYLQKALNDVYKKEGQVKLVLGSAGQGKSHLLHKFAQEAQKAHPELLVLTGYCDQQSGVGDPYLPFRHILQLLLGDVEAKWRGGLISIANAQSLWNAMEETVPKIAKYAPDLISHFLVGAHLVERLVIAGLDKEPWFEEVASLAKEKPLGMLEQPRIISLYTSALQAIAPVKPILLILEDLHWADASSATLFNYLSRHVVESRILIIGSYRLSNVLTNESHPMLEISQELHRLYGDISINLDEQEVEDEREFVNAYIDGEPNELDSSFREAFLSCTQGHALFTAELISAMKDRGDLYQHSGKWFAEANVDWQTLPAKVEGVIEVRVGRLPNEQKELLTVASVQGETFIGEVVAQVQKQDERDVIRTFNREVDKRHQLIQSERLEHLGKQQLSHYRFRHNLFQQYVYGNLPENELTYLHKDTALALEAIYGEKAQNIAPQLAWHFEQANIIEKALKYLLLAGRQAQALGANQEAAINYERGLAIINQITSTPELLPTELAFQASFGLVLIAVEGFASERVKVALERALELCSQVEPNLQLMSIHSGFFHFSFANDNLSHKTSLEWAKESVAIALKQEDPAHLAQAEVLLMTAQFWLGENDKAMKTGYSALSHVHFDKESHEKMINYYPYDQRVLAAPMLALTLLFGGKVKKAQALIATEPFPDLKHATSRGFFLTPNLIIQKFMHNIDQVKSLSEELLKLANDYGYVIMTAWGLVYHGWALAQLGEVEVGVAEMKQGINSMTEGLTLGTYTLAMLAEGLWLLGKQDEALDILAKSFEHSKRKDEFFYLSRLSLMKGQWLEELGAETTEFEPCFIKAIDLAKKQQAHMLELQASLSLAQHWQTCNRKEDIHSLLTELLERITPIIDTDCIPEYKEASQILSDSVSQA